MRLKLRASIDSGNWKRKGDRLLNDLMRRSDVVVLAIDELPLLVHRILKGSKNQEQGENVQRPMSSFRGFDGTSRSIAVGSA